MFDLFKSFCHNICSAVRSLIHYTYLHAGNYFIIFGNSKARGTALNGNKGHILQGCNGVTFSGKAAKIFNR